MSDVFEFDTSVFFNVLLPPIIFNAAYKVPKGKSLSFSLSLPLSILSSCFSFLISLSFSPSSLSLSLSLSLSFSFSLFPSQNPSSATSVPS